jgi:hypothetical protein
MLRNAHAETMCPACSSDLTVEVFPALASSGATPVIAPELENEQTTCYEHPTKAAAALCHRCGRFLCSLCEVEIGGTIWCPACLQLDTPASRPQVVERSRTLYDSIALSLSTWALLFFYPLFFAPPIVFYLAIHYWKAPSSLIPRSKWRFIAALCFASLELCVASFVIFGMYMAFHRRLIPQQP